MSKALGLYNDQLEAGLHVPDSAGDSLTLVHMLFPIKFAVTCIALVLCEEALSDTRSRSKTALGLFAWPEVLQLVPALHIWFERAHPATAIISLIHAILSFCHTHQLYCRLVLHYMRRGFVAH